MIKIERANHFSHLLVLSLTMLALMACATMGNSASDAEQVEALMWVNHLDLLPGDPSVKTSFTYLQSLGSVNGLDISSTTTGDIGIPAGNKVVAMGLQVPPGYSITGVRVCYQSSSSSSYITQIRLAQLQDPPSTASVILDDGTDHTNPGPICVDSTATLVDPNNGEVRLSLRLNFGNTADTIVVRAVGLHLKKS
jgi:hypothetical protein